MEPKKYAVGIWNPETTKYEIHDRTNILEYAQSKRDEYIKQGLKAITLVYNE